ncbi:MAG: hypothetical protein FWG68_09025 [Defluviitaleaceae bacterium]|nr:hypothetical protein [Defluviitaleaceae bacterium]
MAMTELVVKVDETTHNEFSKLCEGIGLNADSAVNILIKKAVQTREMLFEGATVQNRQPLPRKKTIRESLKEPKSSDTMENFAKSLETMRKQAELDGSSEMTMDEINAEIALARAENQEKETLLRELRAKSALFEDQTKLLPVEQLWADELDMEIEERQNGWAVTIHG